MSTEFPGSERDPMSQAPRHRKRRPNRLNRAHAGQSLDPTLTRQGPLAHPGSYLWGLGGILFVAYVFNAGGLQTWLDAFLGGIDKSAKSHNDEVATFVIAALPYLGFGLVAILLFLILNSLVRSAQSALKRWRLGRRGEVSVDDFIEQAAQYQVGIKVAREAYRQLLPHYEQQRSVRLSDRFDGILRMKPVDVSDLYGDLLRSGERIRRGGDDGSRLETVLDLILAVENAEFRSLSDSKLHLRAEREANALVRKRPSFAERMRRSVTRSKIRQAAAAEARPRDVSFVRPARLAVKEMKPKVVEADKKPISAG
jgi:hypothetical protein